MTIYVCLAWYLGLLISFVGWGTIFARYVVGEEDADVGLRAGWGIASLLTIGGVLLVFSIATAPVLVALVVVGLVAAAHALWRRRRDWGSRAKALVRSIAKHPAAAAMVALIVAISVCRLAAMSFRTSDTFRTDDDSVAYAFFPKEIAESGTTFQPFSHRHAQSMNGQSFLQALAVPVVRIRHVYGLDAGLFVLVAILLVAGISKKPWLERSPLAMLPELSLALLPGSRINLNSQFTGIVVFLTLYRTLARPGAASNDRRNAFVVAACVLAAFVLRPMNPPALVVIVAVAYGIPLLRRNDPEPFRKKAGAILMVGAFSLLLLLPWFITSYRSHGTPLFPVLDGNITHLPPRVRPHSYLAKELFWALFDDTGLSTLLCFVLAGLCLRAPSTRHARTALVLGCLAAWVIFVLVFPGGWREQVPRLLFPTFAAMAFAIAGESMALLGGSDEQAIRLGRLIPAALVTIALVLNLHERRDALIKEFQEDVDLLANAKTETEEFDARWHRYTEMQEKTDPGAGIMVLAVDGYLFDAKRNRIYTPDHPGLAGPKPGWPTQDSDDDAIRYFLANGVRYVVLSSERPDPFNLRTWISRVGTSHPDDPNVWVQADWAPFIVPALEQMDRIATLRKQVFKDEGFVIVDLATAP